MVHGPDDAESVAHSLLAAWLASALDEPGEDRLRACERAVVAASRAAEEVHIDALSLLHGVLETELGRLDPQDVQRLRLEAHQHLLRIDSHPITLFRLLRTFHPGALRTPPLHAR